MKAVRLYEYGSADNLKYEENVPDPEIADDEVLVSAAASSINPVDWKMRSGEAKERFPVTFPGILGRDVSGVVRAVGSNVRGVAVGDRVMALTTATYAELVAVKAAEVNHVPEGVSITDAAALPLIILTGEQLIREACELKPGQSVLVTGALGSVGRAAVHTAKKMGAHVIAGVRKAQLDAAKGLGVDVVALDDKDSIEKLGKVDAIADTLGDKVTTPLLNHIREGGICGTVVTPPPDVTLHPELKLVRMRAHPDPAKVLEFTEDYRVGKFIVPIARRFTLQEAAEAQTFAEHGGAGGKVLLLML
ncbi:MAG: NADP-dependent oxidoreductase [Janthinobacterium lividum]